MQAAFRFFWSALGTGFEYRGVRDQALVRVFWAGAESRNSGVLCFC